MKNGFIYTRWLLTLTFCCLMGLLAVGMMTVHSKRTIRTLAVDLDHKESELEELERRQDILDMDLASSLNPEYLKELIGTSKLRLGPPREDRIILVHPQQNPSAQKPFGIDLPDKAPGYRTRFELADNGRRESD